jgi:cytochrome b pre-mRNA-processing protein 3
MRSIGEAFYGRAAAYDAALASPDDGALAEALQRNVYGGEQGSAVAARQLVLYVREVSAALEVQDAGSLLRGELQLPQPAEFLS